MLSYILHIIFYTYFLVVTIVKHLIGLGFGGEGNASFSTHLL